MRKFKFDIDDWTGGNTIGKSMGDAVGSTLKNPHTTIIDYYSNDDLFIMSLHKANDDAYVKYRVDNGEWKIPETLTCAEDTYVININCDDPNPNKVYRIEIDHKNVTAGLFSDNNKTKVIQLGDWVILHSTKYAHIDGSVEFYFPKKQTTIPEDLFKNFNKKCKSLYGFFNNSKITEIPVGLLDGFTEVEDITSLFSNTPISEIPHDLFKDCTNVIDARLLFNNTNITNVERGIFSYFEKLKRMRITDPDSFSLCTYSTFNVESRIAICENNNIDPYDKEGYIDFLFNK